MVELKQERQTLQDKLASATRTIESLKASSSGSQQVSEFHMRMRVEGRGGGGGGGGGAWLLCGWMGVVLRVVVYCSVVTREKTKQVGKCEHQIILVVLTHSWYHIKENLPKKRFS